MTTTTTRRTNDDDLLALIAANHELHRNAPPIGLDEADSERAVALGAQIEATIPVTLQGVLALLEYTDWENDPATVSAVAGLRAIVAEGERNDDSELLALIAERGRLEEQTEADSEETVGETAYNTLVTRIGVEIGKLDDQIADWVAQTPTGIIAQVGVLRSLHSSAFSAEDVDHEYDCYDRLTASMTTAIRQLAGGVG